MRVKICGVNSPAAFDAAAEAGADWIGFVFHGASPRCVSPGMAAQLSARLPGGPARVGLLVDPGDDDLARVLDALHLHALQLYASPERLSFVRAKFDVPVWQSVGVATSQDLPGTAGIAAALVVEPRAPREAGRPGGLGLSLDWSVLAGWDPGAPWLLAGGLTPENVAEAARRSGARAVDVSSGVESAPGVKDPARIAAFVKEAKTFINAVAN